jgi:hypothetical protein
MATPRVHLVCIVPLYSTHVLLIVALVDTGANVTCVLSSLLPQLGATLVVKEGNLEDYKGMLDDRIGVVRLRTYVYSETILCC